MSRRPIRVQFVYSAGLNIRGALLRRPPNLQGSELLRLQLGQAIAPHLPEDIEFGATHFGGRLLTFDRWLALQKPAIFILSKHRAYNITEDELARLRRIAIAVGVDHKDGDLSQIDLSRFDFHIASSHAALRALQVLLAEAPAPPGGTAHAGLLLQSPDARLLTLAFRPRDRFAALYLGDPANSFIPPRIAPEITSFSILRAADMDAVLPRLPEFNLHYAVRPAASSDIRRGYKPFTKGMTAAVCASNIIVNAEVDDAVDLLSPDYPYLVRSRDDAEVSEVFARARDDFGSATWARGLDMMAQLRDRVSPPALARQLTEIIRAVSA